MCLTIRDYLSSSCSVADFQASVNAYVTALGSALALDSTLPVALDTNVLLNELNLDQERRNRFEQFLKSRGHRILVPSQVKEEYSRYFERRPHCFDLAAMTVLPALEEADKSQFIDDYQGLLALDDPQPFPGSGDQKGKPDHPYGDFLIFVELLKFMREEKTDLVFLTNDIFKGDWLTHDFLPHRHIIEACYLASGQSLVILPAGHFIREYFVEGGAPVAQSYFNYTRIYKSRYNMMWQQAQERLELTQRALSTAESRLLMELRKVKKLLALSDDITHNSYIDLSWLSKMEQFLACLAQEN